MAQLLVRNLDEAVVDRLKERAVAHGRSLEGELRVVLEAAARTPKEEALARLDAIRASARPWQPGDPTAVELIREDRDSR